MSYNYNNLFLDAMDTDQQRAIDEIKLNKAFALQLINDLNKVFQTNYEIVDDQDSVVIRMKRYVSSNWYGSFYFSVTKEGIRFRSTNLGYYECKQYKELGKLYEKYKSNGTTCDSNFLHEGSTRHGFVNFVIPIYRNADNLKESLRDIVYLMEQNQYNKRF
jgi:hypothetical protein